MRPMLVSALALLASSSAFASPPLPLVPVVVVTPPRIFAPVRVQVAPPALRAEVRPVAPSPSHFWAPGHWYWEGGRHVWMGGYWEAPRQGEEWIGPRWVNEGGAWVYRPGHWRVVEQVVPTEVVVESAPPAPIIEEVPVARPQGQVWIPGHWWWQGNHHVWLRGHFEMERRGMAWEPAHWTAEGGRWHFAPGHWRPR